MERGARYDKGRAGARPMLVLCLRADIGARIARLTLIRPPVGIVIGLPGRASPRLMGEDTWVNGPPFPGGTFLWAFRGVKALGAPSPHMDE